MTTRSDDRRVGALVFAGTRVPVDTLFDYLESGETLGEFQRLFPKNVDGQKLPQWQHEITGARRIQYCPDKVTRTVWVTMVNLSHPRETESALRGLAEGRPRSAPTS